MKIIYSSLAAVFILLASFFNIARASLDIVANVDVPQSCNATDIDGMKHDYPRGSAFLAICALEAAIGNGLISSAQFSNAYPSLGLFVTAMNSVVADPNSQYWALYQNGSYASLGLATLPIREGDTIILQLHDFSDNNLGDQVTLNINSLVSDPVRSGTRHRRRALVPLPVAPVPVFSVSGALLYLEGVQKVDGSFAGGDMYTDWASMALVAGGAGDNSKEKVLNYLKEASAPSALLTDNERHVMALLALGQNPYSFNGTDYVKPILDAFDGVQFGDKELINDDIFALLPLSGSGYAAADEIISKDVKFILSKQSSDGSWEGSVDLTAAAIQALKLFEGVEGVTDALAKSSFYVRSKQGDDGGWGDVFATSWIMQTQALLGVKWETNGKSGIDYLSIKQADSGVVNSSPAESEPNQIWATSYAILAALGKPWAEIFVTVAKPALAELAIPAIPEVEPIAAVKKAGSIKVATTTAPVLPTPAAFDAPVVPLAAQVVRAPTGEKKAPLYTAILILAVLSGSLFSFIKPKN